MDVMDAERLREEFSPEELFQLTLEAQVLDTKEYWDYYRALIDSDSQAAGDREVVVNREIPSVGGSGLFRFDDNVTGTLYDLHSEFSKMNLRILRALRFDPTHPRNGYRVND